jgi:release factor glutamine methyltransferase
VKATTAAGTTLAEATTSIGARLAAEGIEDARLDARRLVEAATGLSSERLLMEPRRALGEREAMLLAQMVERRLTREPVSRILGQRAFWGRTFEITPDTLDPRPDTETLIGLALDLAEEEGWRERPIRMLDIGTGSGCIVLTLLAELPYATGLGTDVCNGALVTAARNAGSHCLAGRAVWQHADLIEGVRGTFDLVVSNPPYIPSADIDGLAPEVRGFDPWRALDGGRDGLDLYRRIAVEAGRVLAPGGWIAVEVGAGQADAVAALARTAGAAGGNVDVRTRRDLGGHTRCVAWKPQL